MVKLVEYRNRSTASGSGTNASSSAEIDDLPVSYIEMDRFGFITRANRLAHAQHAKEAGELIGKLTWELMPTREQEPACAAFFQIMESGIDPPVVQRSIYTSAAEFRLFEMHRAVIRNDRGEPAGMRVIGIDITEKQQELAAAQKQRIWLESVLASLADAVIVTDALGFIRYINTAAEKLFGWRASELIGRTIENSMPILTFLSSNQAQLCFSLKLSGPCQGVATMLDREHRELRVEIGTSPILDQESGYAEGVVSVLRRLKDPNQINA